MILKSMGVECKKDDMDTYSADVDEESSGKFSFIMFCSVTNMFQCITVSTQSFQVAAKFMIEDDEE